MIDIIKLFFALRREFGRDKSKLAHASSDSKLRKEEKHA